MDEDLTSNSSSEAPLHQKEKTSVSQRVSKFEKKDKYQEKSSETNETIQPQNSSALSRKLENMGLSPLYWDKHFKELGFESKEQLQHIDQSTLNKLLSKTKHDWEKTALNKLFYENNREEISRQQAAFEKMRNKIPDTQKYVIDTFQKNADRRKVNNEDNSWVKTSDLDMRMNEKLKMETSDQGVVGRIPLQNCDVVRKISAGQILRGQFFYKDKQESSTYRQKLIKVDDGIELMSPGICETMDTLEFNNKKQSDEVDSALRQTGISVACGLMKGIPFSPGIQGNLSVGYTNIKENKTTSDEQESFVKIYQILNVPTASFTLANQNVYLSPCALEALKHLHDTFENRPSFFERECLLFFHEFGSHYYTGTSHFGGRYVWTVTSIANSRDKRSENYKTAKLALDGSVGGGLSWFCGGEIRGSFQYDSEEVKKTRSFSESCYITKKLEKFGGPQEVDDTASWKKGLTEYNETWVIIDKDVSQKCYEGVWKLIQNRVNDFSNPATFSMNIHQVWKKVYIEAGFNMNWSRTQLFHDWRLESSLWETNPRQSFPTNGNIYKT